MPGKVAVVAAIIRRNGLFLATRRPAGKKAAGFWEFPGGKIESGETPAVALARELEEELGVHATVFDEIYTIELPTLTLHFLRCRLTPDASVEPREQQEFQWCEAERLTRLNWLEPDRPVADFLTA